MLSVAVHIDAAALVAMVGELTRRVGHDGANRAALLSEVQALADDPLAFFELVSDSGAGQITARAQPNRRFETLLAVLMSPALPCAEAAE